MSDPLWRAVRLLEVRPGRAVAAVLAGAGSLGSAVALAAVSAWLIARASQMPPVMTLTIAAVAVRTFGVSRGLLRYVERLVSHDLALRGMATMRTTLYRRLAEGGGAHLHTLRRGDLLARVGADVDSVGDLVVRGLLPAATAAVVGLGSVALLAAFLPAAGAALGLCLLLAGLVSPWYAVRAARAGEERSANARAAVAATTLTLLDGASELTVAGRVEHLLGDLRRAEGETAAAADTVAYPAALAAALQPAATGLAVLAALVLGVPATVSGALSPVELAVVVLTPLAAFEATALLPAAAVQLLRSREAARRVLDLLDGGTVPRSAPLRADHPTPTGGSPRLVAEGLSVGWPGKPPVLGGIDLFLEPGRRIVVVGPSGAGKTTLLLTLAGLLRPADGAALLDGRAVADGERAEVAAAVALTAEDAHVFDTTVLENLRVGRGDVTPEEARRTLRGVGLGPWLDGLPAGLGTTLGTDAHRISGGERRRLLLARALLCPAPLLLLDEPTEHVDEDGPALLAGLLDGTLAPGRGVLVVTHRREGLDAADEVIELDGSGGPEDPPSST